MLGDVVATNAYRVLEGEGLMCFPIQRQHGGYEWGKTRWCLHVARPSDGLLLSL